MPRVIVFDVIETMLDTSALEPHFERVFGDPRVLREWFSQLLLYSEVATIAGSYFDFSTIAGATLEMTAESRKVTLSSTDREQILEAMLSLPPHEDVHDALKLLADAGLRLVTLTNSSQRAMEEQLTNAGIENYFERRFSVDSVRKFKPAPETYRMVAKELDLPTSGLRMVAAHAWDIIGAMQVGCAAAFVARPGKVLNPLADKPDIVGEDLRKVAKEIIRIELPEKSRPAFD
jgi:2-haloacid dehalogenase